MHPQSTTHVTGSPKSFIPNDHTDEQESVQQQPQQQQSQQQPVASLLEKYSNLHKGIDQAREEYKKRISEIQGIEQAIEQLVEMDRPDMEQRTNKTIQEQQDLTQTLELTHERLVQVQEAESQVKSARDQDLIKLEVAKRISRDNQYRFLQACKDFQGKVQRWSYLGECVGMKKLSISLNAYTALLLMKATGNEERENKDEDEQEKNEDCDGNNIDRNDEMRSKLFQSLFSTLIEMADADDKEEQDQETDDEDLQQAIKNLLHQKQLHDEIQKDVLELKTQKTTLLQQIEKRVSQKQNLQSQCDRLNTDVHDLRTQIESFQRQTEEAESMKAAFKNGKQRKKIDVISS
jgi:hypothetical protein